MGDKLGLKGTVEDTIVARRLLNESVALINAGKYEDAYSSADSAGKIYTRYLVPESIELAEVLHQKGRAFSNSDQYDKAVEFLQKALDIRLKYYGQYHSEVASSYGNLGVVFNQKKECLLAVEHNQKALEILKSDALLSGHVNLLQG
jgi:tetratricopeptide (TPR) repeat protein